MKVAVCVKHAVDESDLKLDPTGAPLLEGSAAKMSTFDKNAVEEAVRLKTASQGELVVFTVGVPDARKTMKEALAMGADRGVLVVDRLSGSDSLRTAELLCAAIKRGGPFDIVLASEGSSDTYSGQVPPMLAELLGIPYVGYAKSVAVEGEKVRAERSLEESLESVEAKLPAVISVVSEINEPRYPTLIQIMQASKKTVEELKGEELAPPLPNPRISLLSMSAQPSVRKRVMIEGSPEEAAAKLVDALAKEGVI